MLKIFIWNVCAGPTDQQLSHLTTQTDADILILTEYRRSHLGEPPLTALAEAGWPHQFTPITSSEPRGVLVASKHPLTLPPSDATLALGALEKSLRPRLLDVRLASRDLSLVAVYMPYADGPEKEALWTALNRYAEAHSDRRFVIAGDMNSSTAGETESGYVYTPQPLEQMRSIATDAWAYVADRDGRANSERYTWYATRGERRFGLRLDYAFLSPALRPHFLDARHDHGIRERGLSDHSALLVDLAI